MRVSLTLVVPVLSTVCLYYRIYLWILFCFAVKWISNVWLGNDLNECILRSGWWWGGLLCWQPRASVVSSERTSSRGGVRSKPRWRTRTPKTTTPRKCRSMEVQLTTRTTDFFVVAQMSVDLVGFVILVGFGYDLPRLIEVNSTIRGRFFREWEARRAFNSQVWFVQDYILYLFRLKSNGFQIDFDKKGRRGKRKRRRTGWLWVLKPHNESVVCSSGTNFRS